VALLVLFDGKFVNHRGIFNSIE